MFIYISPILAGYITKQPLFINLIGMFAPITTSANVLLFFIAARVTPFLSYFIRSLIEGTSVSSSWLAFSQRQKAVSVTCYACGKLMFRRSTFCKPRNRDDCADVSRETLRLISITTIRSGRIAERVHRFDGCSRLFRDAGFFYISFFLLSRTSVMSMRRAS
jgi:hypothetical protein